MSPNYPDMTIYFDISAAVHHRAGLGRYAESLARALLSNLEPTQSTNLPIYQPTNLPTYQPTSLPISQFTNLAFFYNREAGIEPLAGLEHIPAATVNLGYKPWRLLVWLGQLGRIGFNHLVPGATLFHATEHLLLPLRGAPPSSPSTI